MQIIKSIVETSIQNMNNIYLYSSLDGCVQKLLVPSHSVGDFYGQSTVQTSSGMQYITVVCHRKGITYDCCIYAYHGNCPGMECYNGIVM